MRLFIEGQVIAIIERGNKKTDMAVILSGFETAKVIINKNDNEIIQNVQTGEIIQIPVNLNIYKDKPYFMKVYKND